MTGVFRDAQAADLSILATKADLLETKAELLQMKIEFRREIVESKFEILKWVLSAIGFQTIVGGGAIVALTKGLP